MKEKEMNKQILSKLCHVAEKIVSRLRLNPGAYTATEINKMNKKGEFFKGLDDKGETIHIEFDFFSCSLPLCMIFAFIAKFEKLAGVGNKKHSFIIEPENNLYLSKVVAQISKNDASLCDSVNMVHNNDNTSLQDDEVICLDVRRGEACVVDGVAAQIRALRVVDRSEYDENQTRPRIDGVTWKKMCNKAGKDGALLVCTLIAGCWVSECCGIVSTVDEGRGLDYRKFFANVDPYRLVGMDKKVWGQTKKWLSANMGLYAGDAKLLIIEHSKNWQFLNFRFQNKDTEAVVTAYFPCTSTSNEYFCMGFNCEKILALNEFKMYVPTSFERGAIFDDRDNIRLIMPLYLYDDCRMWHYDKVTYTVDIFDLVRLSGRTPIIAPRKNHRFFVCTFK